MTKRLSKKQVERVLLLTDLVAERTSEAQRLRGEQAAQQARLAACEQEVWDARAEIKTILQERLAAPADATAPAEEVTP
jgi:hypothetical protein